MNTPWLGHYFLLILLAGSLVLTYFIFQPFLTPLILAAVFAVVLQPLYKRIHRSIPHWPSSAALLTVLISVVAILVPLMLIGTQIGLEAQNLYTDLRSPETRAALLGTARDLESAIIQYIPAARGFSAELSANLSTYAETGLQWLIGNLGGAVSSAASLVLKFFLFFIALYYLLKDGAKLKDRIVQLSPLRDAYDESIFNKLELAVNSVIKGNLMIALIQGVLTAIGFTIFGVPNPVLWGTVAAIAALIPGIGTGLVFIPTVFFMLFTGHPGAALGLTLWGILAVGLIDNFLAPQLIGAGVKLHPLLVLLSVLGGLAFFGPIGIFLGPLSLSLLFAFISIYTEISRRTA
ncbi:MAG: AI-2E family transporter [Patescibacteria group bacterium]